MPDNLSTPFNSYGQILSWGGERYAAYLLSQGVDPGQLAPRMQAKFGPATPETMQDVIAFSRGMVKAGHDLTGTPQAEPYDISAIPQNPYLFGGDISQGRTLLGATISGPDPSIDKFVSMSFPTIPSPLDILSQFNVSLPDWAANYPEEFNKWVSARQDDSAVLLRFIERVF